MIKALGKLGIQVSKFSGIKNIYKNPTTSYLMVKNWKLSPKISNKTRIALLTIYIQHCTGDSSQARNRKNVHVEKEEVKTISAGNMILYMGTQGNPLKKSIETDMRSASLQDTRFIYKNELYLVAT